MDGICRALAEEQEEEKTLLGGLQVCRFAVHTPRGDSSWIGRSVGEVPGMGLCLSH